MYAKIVNGVVVAYPYTLLALRQDNPQVSFPQMPSSETLMEFDAYEVLPSPKPAFDAMLTRCVEGTPALIAGQWTQTWNIVSLSAEEIAAKQLVADDAAAADYTKAAPVIQYLATHTPAECEAWVAANVTDLASAKNLLGKFALALCVLSRREFR